MAQDGTRRFNWARLPLIATIARVLCREVTLENEYLRVQYEVVRSKVPGRIRFAMRPSAPKASVASSPSQPLRLLLAGATVARWDSHPLKTGALSRRTQYSDPTGFHGCPLSVPMQSVCPSIRARTTLPSTATAIPL